MIMQLRETVIGLEQRPSDNWDAVFRRLIVPVLGLFLAAFVLSPLNEDVRGMFAAAKQADFHGSFPSNVVDAWDMKPIANRIIYYGLYRSATQFVSFKEKWLFEPASKSICIVIGFVVMVLITRFVGQGTQISSDSWSHSRVLAVISILAVSYYVILQPEWFASLLLLIAIGLTVSESPFSALAAGLVASILFPLKGVTVLLVPIVPAAWALVGLDWRPRSKPFLVGLSFGIALTIMFFMVFPQSWRDLVDATAYQNSVGNFAPIRRVLRTIGVGFGGAMTHVPMLYVGLECTVLVVMAGVARRSLSDSLLLIAAWGCAIAAVVIQGKWFDYHYAVAIVPALLSIGVWCSGRYSDWRASLSTKREWILIGLAFLANLVFSVITWRYAPSQREMIPWALGATTVICGCLLRCHRFFASRKIMPITALVLTVVGWSVFSAPWTGRARSAAAAGEEQMKVFLGLDQRYELSREPSLLYLECGQASYYLGVSSALRWFYPVPLQRVHSNPSLFSSDVHLRATNGLVGYTGRFVIVDETWMRYAAEHVPAMNKKLDAEYEQVWAGDVLQDQGQSNRFKLLMRK